MKKSIFILVIMLWVTNTLSAQDISAHQWKNRVLIVMAESKDSELLQQQITIFKENEQGILERKLFISLFTPNEFAIYNRQELDWQPFTTQNHSNVLIDSELEITLIGLDGQTKHRMYGLTPVQEIFQIIDSMPMRQSELRNKQN